MRTSRSSVKVSPAYLNETDNNDSKNTAPEDKVKIEWRKWFRPMLFTLAVVGLHADPKWPVVKVYGICVVLLMWANFCRVLTSFSLNLNLTFLTIVWMLEVCLIAALYVRAHIFLKVDKIYQRLDKMELCFTTMRAFNSREQKNTKPCDSIKKVRHATRTFFTIVVFVTVLTVLVNVSFLCYLAIFAGSGYNDYTLPFKVMDRNSTVYRALIITLEVFDVYCSSAWILPLGHIIHCGYAFGTQFLRLSRVMKSRVDKATGGFHGNMEDFLLLHRQLVRNVNMFNDRFKYVISCFLGFGVASVCALLYIVVKNSTNYITVWYITMYCFWAGFTLGTMLVILFGGSVLYEHAASMGDVLRLLKPTELDAKQFQVLNTFHQELATNETGFTCGGFFVVNRDSALMRIVQVFGAIVTYAVVVLTLPQNE